MLLVLVSTSAASAPVQQGSDCSRGPRPRVNVFRICRSTLFLAPGAVALSALRRGQACPGRELRMVGTDVATLPAVAVLRLVQPKSRLLLFDLKSKVPKMQQHLAPRRLISNRTFFLSLCRSVAGVDGIGIVDGVQVALPAFGPARAVCVAPVAESDDGALLDLTGRAN